MVFAEDHLKWLTVPSHMALSYFSAIRERPPQEEVWNLLKRRELKNVCCRDVPQVVLAILSASLAPAFARRWTLKRVLLLSLGSDLALSDTN